MRITFQQSMIAVSVFLTMVGWSLPVFAATNEATDPGGGGVSITDSGTVTVNSSALQLVKQVYDTGGSCLASIPADAACNSSATSVTVPSGTNLKFMIFVRNDTDVSLSDVRIEDLLADTGTDFTYVANSIKRTPMNATAPLDTDTIGTIFTAADGGTVMTDVVGGPDDEASMDTTASPDRMTVGAVTGQANAAVSVTAHRTFAVLFQASKN